eukprot:1559988-Amphidinium_carterae.1
MILGLVESLHQMGHCSLNQRARTTLDGRDSLLFLRRLDAAEASSKNKKPTIGAQGEHVLQWELSLKGE